MDTGNALSDVIIQIIANNNCLDARLRLHTHFQVLVCGPPEVG